MAALIQPSERLSAASPAGNILVVDHITKRFETPEGVVTAVEDVSLGVAPGEFLGVIGTSGCGKSTLFNIIGGLLDGYDGSVKVAGELLRGPPPSYGHVFPGESTFPPPTLPPTLSF